MIVSRASPLQMRRMARCWCIAMPAANSVRLSRRSRHAAYGARPANRTGGCWAHGPTLPIRCTEPMRSERKRRCAYGGRVVGRRYFDRDISWLTWDRHPRIPSSLRFHRGIKHLRGEFWPAMVALVTRGADDTPLAIHRTFLAATVGQGAGRSAEDDARSMPWRCGAARSSLVMC